MMVRAVSVFNKGNNQQQLMQLLQCCSPERDMVCGMRFSTVKISHGFSGQFGASAECVKSGHSVHRTQLERALRDTPFSAYHHTNTPMVAKPTYRPVMT